MAHKLTRARWFFHRHSWTPSVDDICLALSSVQQVEKDRIVKYAFFKDAAATLAGRLLIRKFVSGVTGLSWDEFVLLRDEREKPCYPGLPNVSFNVSHQGAYTVLAGETGGAKIGVDVMEMKYTGGKPLQEFFRVMYRQLTDREWQTVKESSQETIQERTFFRIWTLKESYIKATGTGMNVPLRSIEFKIHSKLEGVGNYVQDTEIFVDGMKQPDWRFQEVLLKENYCVAVAIQCTTSDLDLYHPLPFEEVHFKDIARSCKTIIPADPAGAEALFAKFSLEDKK